MLEVKIYKFDELDTRLLYEILRLRSDVFIVEQKCAFQDLDEIDYESLHVLGLDVSGILAAYCRIIPPGKLYTEASIGRVAVPMMYRKKNLGRFIFNQSDTECQRLFPGHPIKLMAQEYLYNFYHSYGYEQTSEPFLEDDILHIYMVKTNIDF